MGNCCGKESGNFQGEGRSLGSTPANAPAQQPGGRASVPSPRTSGGRTLGGTTAPATTAQGSPSPRDAAARAAEERAKATHSSQSKGKLGRQLEAQRGQTQTETLAQNARENVAARDADAASQARNWN
ncbi:hypothetical protein K431DRAFT_288331 [Polychaeton citri CBS 116435]|uniref:Uncharacterized protein n=1 Tax=Polychaeton citri CBS 116435 TaxID=1314669 RepID=A0A9P4UKQ7_9PEZI|nr:hypothetical protein K431DRAFT_288331 [Polychaeton citri CBS 116435]